MFGYVNLYKPTLSDDNYELFKTYYCSLCFRLGKDFNQAVRLSLSYDFTFLAILLDSLSDKKLELTNQRCLKHIGKQKQIAVNNEFIKYSSQMSAVLNFYKLTDDIKDDKSVKAFILRLPYLRQLKKTDPHFEIISDEIIKHLNSLSKLENENCENIDEVSHEFAMIMQYLFSYNIKLKRFGYNLGKFIYIIDAFDDMDDDLKKKHYNVINKKYAYDGTSMKKKQIASEIDFILTYTLSQLADEFEKLDIKKNKTLLENIIYFGLRQKKDSILFKEGEKANEKSI